MSRIEWRPAKAYEVAALGPIKAPEPTTSELRRAAFETENSFSAFLSEWSHQAENEERIEGFNPYEGLDDEYLMFSEAFRDAHNPEQVEAIKQKIEREIANRQTLAEGGVEAFAWQVAAGITDPTLLPLTLVPIARAGAQAGRAGFTAARTAAAIGGLAAGEAALAESFLHQSQHTRTLQESMIAIGGSAIIGGILGGVAGVSAKQFERASNDAAKYVKRAIETEGLEHIDDLPPGSTTGAMEVTRSIDGSGIDAVGVEFNPTLRGLRSESESMRTFTDNLYDHNFTTKANREFKASDESVEIQLINDLERYGGIIGTVLPTEYKKMGGARTILGARMKTGMSYSDFSEAVGRAMFRGDVHEIPEVQSAARQLRPIYEEIAGEFQQLGDLPLHLVTKYAKSYRTRIFDQAKIRENPKQLFGVLLSHFTAKTGDEDVARQLASGTMDNIQKTQLGLMHPDNIVPSSPFLKTRTLDIDDEILEPFLVNDIEQIMRMYLRSTLPEIHLRKKFGYVEQKRLAKGQMGPPEGEMTPLQRTKLAVLEDVRDDYDSLMAAEKDPKKIKALDKEKVSALDDVNAGFGLITGTYGLPKSEHKWLANMANFLRGMSFMAMLGMMTIAAIPDVSRLMMQHGFRPFMRAMPAAFTQFVGEASKMARKDLKRMGFALDTVTNARAYSLGDISDFGTRMEKWTRRFAQYTGMNHWNQELKMVAGMIAQDEFIRRSLNYSKLSNKMKTRMAKAGIDEKTAKKIAAEWNESGDTIKNLYHANTMDWKDQALARKFERILHSDVNNTILTPSLGDKPLLMSTQTGMTIFQFKTFFLAAHNKVLLPVAHEMSHKDFTALTGVMTAGALGAFVEYVRMNASGRGDELKDYKLRDWVRAGVDRGGMATIPMEGLNLMDRLTHGRLSSALGMQEGSRYFYRNMLGSALGPSAGLVEDATSLVQNVFKHGGMTASDTYLFRKMTPYQNHVLVRHLTDHLQESAIDYFDLEDNRRQR